MFSNQCSTKLRGWYYFRMVFYIVTGMLNGWLLLLVGAGQAYSI